MCLWSCGRSSDTVRAEPNPEDLIGTWNYMIITYPPTPTKNLEFFPNNTWRYCPDDHENQHGTYVTEGNRITFSVARADGVDTYHARWKVYPHYDYTHTGKKIILGNTLRLAFDDDRHLHVPVQILTPNTPCYE